MFLFCFWFFVRGWFLVKVGVGVIFLSWFWLKSGGNLRTYAQEKGLVGSEKGWSKRASRSCWRKSHDRKFKKSSRRTIKTVALIFERGSGGVGEWKVWGWSLKVSGQPWFWKFKKARDQSLSLILKIAPNPTFYYLTSLLTTNINIFTFRTLYKKSGLKPSFTSDILTTYTRYHIFLLSFLR